MKIIALVCGLLSGVIGVLAAFSFLKGSKPMPWTCSPTWRSEAGAPTGRSTARLLAQLTPTQYLEHDPEKWKPVFRKDHAPPKC